MSETRAPYRFAAQTADNRRHTAILRQLVRVGWQAQRMGMETRDVLASAAATEALRQLDDLQEAIERARARIIEEGQ